MEKTKKMDTGIVYGIIAGVAVILFTVVLYLGGVSWFVHPLAYFAYAIPIVLAVLAAVKAKKLNGGYLAFSAALKTTFIVFVVASLLSTIFSYLLFNIIDVPFREALMQEAAVKAEVMMEKFGMSQEQIDKATAEMMSGNNFTVGKTILNMAFGLIISFIISLIIAAIVKKNKPPFETSTNQPS